MTRSPANPVAAPAAVASASRPPTATDAGLLPEDHWLRSVRGMVWIGVLSLLFVALFWEFFHFTWRASKDPNWSHTIVIPFISAFYIFQHRQRLLATPRRVCWWGLPLFFFGLLSYAWWIYPGRNDMFRGYAMILSLAGLLLLLLGPRIMRVLAFPVAFLVFAVKIPDAIWQQVAFKLQVIASHGSAFVLQVISLFMDYEVDHAGSTLHMSFRNAAGVMTTESLNIAEACSGLRMLMAFLALGVALAFLFDRLWWQRLIMVLLAVPIAIAVNIGRVTALGLLTLYDPEMAQGSFHTMVGMLMLIPAMGLFLALGWVLDKMVIREGPAEADEPAASPTDDPGADAGPARRGLNWPAIARGLAIGVGVTLAVGLLYTVSLDAASGQEILPAMPTAVLWVLAALLAVGVVAMFALLPRMLPGTGRLPVMLALCAGVLGTAAVGKAGVVSLTELALLKLPIEPRHSFEMLPRDVGPWQMHSQEDRLPPEIIEALGTTTYITRTYVDTRHNVDGEASFAAGHVVRLHIAYYTGTVDTVPHVPERCFVAGGLEQINSGSTRLTLDASPYSVDTDLGQYTFDTQINDPARPDAATLVPELNIDASRFVFGSTTDVLNTQRHSVIYFFAANGRYLASPNLVRLSGFDPTDRYSYYCKIEVMVPGIGDADRATAVTSDFLTHMLPEIMATLPDWTQVQSGAYPADDPS